MFGKSLAYRRQVKPVAFARDHGHAHDLFKLGYLLGHVSLST